MAVADTGSAHPSDLDPNTREAIFRATYDDLPTFIDLIFSQSFAGDFTRGDWVLQRGDYLQGSRKTCYVGPRRHFKSTGFYAHWMWRLWQARFNALDEVEWADGRKELEGQYFSYKEKSAGYHIGEAKDSIKALIERNPWFSGIQDEKPQAETKGKWSWDGDHHSTLTPHGMLSHTRGINADIIYVDDPFQDDDSKAGTGPLRPTKVLKINYIFKSNVIEIPTEETDELHIATTPQTEDDFTFDHQLMDEFDHWVQPAIKNKQSQEVLWPEWMDYDDLMAKKEQIGPKLFNQEFMCSPKSSEISFFKQETVETMVEPGLLDHGADGLTGEWEWPWSNYQPRVVAGHDIGKKQHPAHFAVFACLPRDIPDGSGKLKSRKAGHLIQLHQKWMDNWDYNRQNRYHQQAISYFGIDEVRVDNTRGEFESLDEMGQLPSETKLFTLTGGSKGEMAGYLDVFSSSGRVKLLEDARQTRQLTVVTQDLEAVETSEGHGEPFTSIGLAVMASQQRSWGSSFGTLEM